MENKSNSENQPLTIDDIINEIKRKSSDGDYIYRGERKRHEKVSSALYREYDEIRKHITFDSDIFDLRIVQTGMLKVAKKHIGEPHQDIFLDNDVRGNRSRSIRGPNQYFILTADEIELLTQLQHYGGKTNLIDFTTDYLIAIFFACSGEPKKDGRVIVLQQTENIKNMIIRPQNPERRVIGQKSVFLHPPKGFIDVPDKYKVIIPATLKDQFLKYLRKFHGISAETIYNDIYGFITNQNIQRNAYIQFYLALTLQYKGNEAKSDAEKQQAYVDAIEHYNQTIELDSELSVAYGNLAECWLHLGKWDNARKEFTTVKNMGYDIISAFHNDYKDVAAFENKTGLTVPQDLAEMLGG